MFFAFLSLSRHSLLLLLVPSVHAKQTFEGKDIENRRPNSSKRKFLSSSTPLQTPYQRHSSLVTRSTENVQGIRKKLRMADMITPIHEPVTPVPFNVHEASFTAESTTTTVEKTRCIKNDQHVKQLSYGLEKEFRFSWNGRKISLLDFAEKYGPLEKCEQSCIRFNVSAIVCSVTADNSSRLRFDIRGIPTAFLGQRNFSHIQVKGNVNDLRTELVKRGCAASNLNDMWIANHYRWIVWKLASMERRFPVPLAKKYLTYDHVLHQLRHRFQKEIQEAKRPILKKVLNRDISSSAPMILCVSKIIGNGDSKQIKLHLTDGWYEVPSLIDDNLQDIVRRRKIVVGSKILICNALLEGADEGIDPLDKFYQGSVRSFSVRLKLFSNSSRLCTWSAKLGYLKPTNAIISRGGVFGTNAIADIIPGGGHVPSIDLVVCKKYPTLYMEETAVAGSSDTTKRSISEVENFANLKAFEDKRNQIADKVTESLHIECMKVRERKIALIFRSISLCLTFN